MSKAMVRTGGAVDPARRIVERAGGRMIADYGQTMLVEAPDEALDDLRNEGLDVRPAEPPAQVEISGFRVSAEDLAATAGAGEPGVAAAELAPQVGERSWIVVLAGPLHPDWRRQLEDAGARLDQRLARDHYLVRAPSAAAARLAELAFVVSVAPYHPALKVNPKLAAARRTLAAGVAGLETAKVAAAPEELAAPAAPSPAEPALPVTVHSEVIPEPAEAGNLELVLFPDADAEALAGALAAQGVEVIDRGREILVVLADESEVPRLAALPQVREVNPHYPPALYNHVAVGLAGCDRVQNDLGLDGSGQIVGVADTGLDTGTADGTLHPDFLGRVVSLQALGRPGDASDIDNHGTHVAGSILGGGGASNGRVRGMAPAARLVFQSVMTSGRTLGGLPADLDDLFGAARAEGARIHNNSWGSMNSDGAYLASSRQVDDFAFRHRDFLILFAAGNDAPKKVSAPGTAKNALTVGASESLRPLPSTVRFPASPSFPSGAQISDLDRQADNADDIASFSSPGPTDGGRRKPDVVAPGSWILSCRSSVSTADLGADGFPGTGDEDGAFSHDEAVGRGLPGRGLFGGGDRDAPPLPAGAGEGAAERYMYSSGTSMATPITSGACALVRQFLVERAGHQPSAALIKALVVNGARDVGGGAPGALQGWGRIDIGASLGLGPAGPVSFDDGLDSAVATGDLRSYFVQVGTGPTGPLAVTLVWRDAPGPALQNLLHLRVVQVATGDEHRSEAVSDLRNNVQKVVLPSPAPGLYRVEVEGIDVGEPIPEIASGTRQDYALVVAGATPALRPSA